MHLFPRRVGRWKPDEGDQAVEVTDAPERPVGAVEREVADAGVLQQHRPCGASSGRDEPDRGRRRCRWCSTASRPTGSLASDVTVYIAGPLMSTSRSTRPVSSASAATCETTPGALTPAYSVRVSAS